MARPSGFSLLETITTLSVLAVVASLGVPPLLQASASSRTRMAAAEIATVFRLADSYAVRHNVNVAVKFRPAKDRVTWELRRDGDGDGVLNNDIVAGIDPLVEPERTLQHIGRDIHFGFPPGTAPRDPSDPRRRLTNLTDPIRFNRSDLASFSPLGGATPGSVYLTDGRTRLAVVRILGATGKVRTAFYHPETETWR